MANRPGGRRAGAAGGRADAAARPGEGRTVPYLGAETLGVAATFIDPRTGDVVERGRGGGHGGGRVLRRLGRRSAPTAGRSPSPRGWRPPFSTRAPVRSSTRIVLPPNGDEGLDGRPFPAGVVCCAVWTRDGSRLLLGTGGYLPGILVDGAPRARARSRSWTPRPGRSWTTCRSTASPRSWQLDRDGRWLAVASANSSEVVILDADTLEVRRRVALSVDDSLWAMSFSPDGRLLAGGGESGKVHVIDTDTWRAREAVPVQRRPTIQLEWLHDNRTVVSDQRDRGRPAVRHRARARPRPRRCPHPSTGRTGYAHVLPAPDDEIVALQRRAGGPAVPAGARGLAPGGVRGRRPRPDAGRVGPLPAGPGVRADLHRPGVRPPAAARPAGRRLPTAAKGALRCRTAG